MCRSLGHRDRCDRTDWGAFQELAAEYNQCKGQVEAAQEEFDGREAAQIEDKLRWEDLQGTGEDRPTRSEFDLECLQESLDKTRSLREAEERLAVLRVRIREHITLSDIDSEFVPEPSEPVEGTLHTLAMRNARASERVQVWLSNVKQGVGSARSVKDDDYLWRAESVRTEDSLSVTEEREYEANRGRAYRKLLAREAISSGRVADDGTPRAGDSKRSSKRAREPSDVDNEGFNKRPRSAE